MQFSFPNRFAVAFFTVAFTITVSVRCLSGQDTNSPEVPYHQPPKLSLLFADDFEKDSRSNYNTKNWVGIALDDYPYPSAEYDLLPPYLKGAYSNALSYTCLLYTSPSPRDRQKSRMPSSA